METIKTAKADFHIDGDVYIYDKKDKKYHKVGMLIPHNTKGFIIKDGEIISAPAVSNCWSKIVEHTENNTCQECGAEERLGKQNNKLICQSCWADTLSEEDIMAL